jgi:xanthine dehydrogenase YagR molybdenum-binding subunit
MAANEEDPRDPSSPVDSAVPVSADTGVSRRDFFKSVGIASLAGTVLTGNREAAAQAPALGPAEVPITLTINGQRYQAKVEPRVTLLDAMRTRLDITGPKRVCDRGSCGACTVIVDGRTYYSCSLLAIEWQGKNIRTVEGLAQGNTLHPVQQAFCDHDAVMCGFCTPGFVMATTALLERNPHPTTDQLKKGLDGNLCRCGANVGLMNAALARAKGGDGADPPRAASGSSVSSAARSRSESSAAQAFQGEVPIAVRHPKYPWPETPRLLGTRVSRLDGPAKTTGRARYSYDIARAGMLYGQILRSPHAHARVKAMDLSAAQKAPGVRAVMATIEPGQKVMYAGEEMAALAAVTEQQAEDAVRLIKVDWEVLPHLATIEDAMRPEAPKVFEPANVRQGNAEEAGDLDAGFEAAAYTVEGVYGTQVQTHVSLETHGCVCEWKGDYLTAWVSTQAVHGTREVFAQSLKIPPANVRVITEFMGGGFGSKFGPDQQGLICARLARAAKAPVKLMLNRKEEHLATGNRPSAFAKVRAGVAANGILTAFEAETWGTGGAGAGSGYPLPYIYLFPTRRRVHKDVYINAGRQRAMRAPGHPQGCFITEVVMDELADAVRMDPVEFRLRNLPPAAPNARWRQYFPLGAERIGWNRRHQTGDPTRGPVRRGLGCAANRWGGAGRGTRAHCQINPDGIVSIRSGTQDIGTATRTLMGIVTAETLGLELDQVRIELGDTNHPFSGGSGGSTTAASVTPAIRVTAGMARDALFARIAPRLGVTADKLELGVGRITVKESSKSVSWRDACKMLGNAPVAVDGQWEPGLSASGTSGVQFADVEVDIETGITRVRKIVCVQDCGLIVDLKTAETQCYGGIISGVNYALFEERILDRETANMVNPNVEWYLMAGQSDIPEIDVVLVDQPERGVIGIGEPPAVATAAAITNAVRNATGVTIRNIPITPDRLLTAFERAGGTN